jgi:hypothetical protein
VLFGLNQGLPVAPMALHQAALLAATQGSFDLKV